MMTRLKLAALTTLTLSSLTAIKPATAALFSKADVDPSRFVAVASPYGSNKAHQLLIIEQASNARACWSENGISPTVVDPLLANFDFTGICGRSTDSNGYSIRMADQDLGLKYSLRVVERNGDLLLVGTPTMDRNAPELQIGRAGGVTNGFAKLYLNTGWRMTRRVYNGQALGHIYLTNDQPLNNAIAAAPVLPIAPRPQQTNVPRSPVAQSVPAVPLEITFTAGDTQATPAPRTSTAVPIAVPMPEATVATGVMQPLPTPSANVPTTIPVAGSRANVPQRAVQPAPSSKTPITGRPIRVPVPTAATTLPSIPRVVSQPVMQPPAMQLPVMQPVVQSSVRQPVMQQPVMQQPVMQQPVMQSPVLSTPKASAVKPGDYVVPTLGL